MSKYRNKKIEVNGIKFDSTSEGRRYEQLLIMERAHVISDLVLQPKFLLQDGFKKCPECGCMPEKGRKCPKCGTMTRTFRPRYYIADFQYFDKKSGKTRIEDVKGSKGFMTDLFRFKWTLFEAKYPDKSLEIVVVKEEPKRPKRQAAQVAISEARRIHA